MEKNTKHILTPMRMKIPKGNSKSQSSWYTLCTVTVLLCSSEMVEQLKRKRKKQKYKIKMIQKTQNPPSLFEYTERIKPNGRMATTTTKSETFRFAFDSHSFFFQHRHTEPRPSLSYPSRFAFHSHKIIFYNGYACLPLLVLWLSSLIPCFSPFFFSVSNLTRNRKYGNEKKNAENK